MPSTVPERKKKRKKKRKLMITKQDLLNQLKNEKGCLHLHHNENSKSKKNRRKSNKKDIEKTREKAIKGLTDFNKIIRDDVVEPGQKRSFDFRARSVKQESFFSNQ